MPHDTPLIATIVGGLVLAFIFGALANRMRVPPLVGYLVAGVVAGPFTPGFVADQSLAPELAEIGVILLMFGVGLHFSVKDLLSVKAIAIPGAVAQIGVATLLGMGMSWLVGWSFGAGLIFGLALSVASTAVLLRALQDRHILDSDEGRIAIGWLIVEDIAMVLVLVLIPALGGVLGATHTGGVAHGAAAGNIWLTLAITIGKVIAFVGVMMIVGRRVIPWLLARIASTGSKELFRLAVLAIALGCAFGATVVFGVSFALGAFFAGMMMSESELSHRAAEESLPLRDAFAVLFFVSVGMLFDPSIIVREPLMVLATLAIILVGKSAASFIIVLLFKRPLKTALVISASLAQIGEFSFILASLGISMGILPPTGKDLILAGAILSILVNPLCFSLSPVIYRWLAKRFGWSTLTLDDAAKTGEERNHTVIVGYGRVGSTAGESLREARQPFAVIEANAELIWKLREKQIHAHCANAVDEDALRAVHVEHANWLLLTLPNAFEAAHVITLARALNPAIRIVARAHSDAEVEYLTERGADYTIMGEREIGLGMSARVMSGLQAAH
ncbi:YbaL family putative K(+) efflux transporter [Silvimonas sp.]|uniref:YbaL family putative K(+) efflux transporter n=1 Tax=Silvimonas sp. TaxID=2650811 RepID=UPI0028490CB1|nr:YbaL family putative K(+) efflux transporter [Silvimonas sp.]MDR3426381.1 YbaL family putative K(+) efflux transporter [Silvimonas sp.]